MAAAGRPGILQEDRGSAGRADRAALRWLWFAFALGCSLTHSDVVIRSVDFGVVEAGVAHRQVLPVKNGGAATAKLLRVEHRSGATAFTVTPAQVQLAPGELSSWNVAFEGPAGLSEARFAAVFDTGTTEFTLRARAAAPCALQEMFDVGDARVGLSTSRTLTVTNPLDEPANVFVGAPSAPFSVEPAGTLRLAPHESREVTVRFSPATGGQIEQPWVLAPSSDCSATRITLTALGVEAPLSFSPGRLDFGVLSPGVSRVISVGVRNHTRAELTLTSLSFSSAAFRSSSVLPMIVPANGVASLLVEALAADSAPFDAMLQVLTDAPEQPTLFLPLLANRTALCLSASRTQLDFAPVELACRSHDARVVLTNTCSHPVRLTGNVASPGFGFVSSPMLSVLEPGGVVELALSHAPDAVGMAAGTLTVSADVLDGTQILTVPLYGEANAASVVDEFERLPPVPQRDVLLVIDDSPTMLPLTESVRRNLSEFASSLRANGEDVRLGVMSTSTSPAELARLRRTTGGASWLDNPTTSELEALSAVKGLSTARSSCLEVLRAAFTLRTDLGAMLRPRAGLQVVCITNGRDGLETPAMPTITALLGAMPQPASVAVVAHLIEVPGCDGLLEHGPLSALVEQTNGLREEICTSRWILDRRTFSFGYRTNFYLRQRPDLLRGPLRVFVNEAEIPGGTCWQYDGSLNVVVFEPLCTPGQGDTLRFQYAPDCQ